MIVEKAILRRSPNFEGQVMAVNRVEKLLRTVTAALDSAGVEYAVVGGNAVAAWVATADEDAVRATKDVDILVRRADLSAIGAALLPHDLIPAEVLGVHMFVERDRPSPKSGVHLVIAGERIRPHYTYPAPELDNAKRLGEPFSVIDLPALVAMKLQAFRPIDQAHIQDMASVGIIDQPLADELPADLRARLAQVLDASQ